MAGSTTISSTSSLLLTGNSTLSVFFYTNEIEWGMKKPNDMPEFKLEIYPISSAIFDEVEWDGRRDAVARLAFTSFGPHRHMFGLQAHKAGNVQ